MVLTGAAKALAANRVAFGVGYLLAPQRTASGWVGSAGEGTVSTVLTRALGARDLALGLGALLAVGERDQRQARRWFAAHAIADGVDLIATLRARDSLPSSGFLFGLGMASASTAIALAAAIGIRFDDSDANTRSV
jgi:hypothetical protein